MSIPGYCLTLSLAIERKCELSGDTLWYILNVLLCITVCSLLFGIVCKLELVHKMKCSCKVVCNEIDVIKKS